MKYLITAILIIGFVFACGNAYSDDRCKTKIVNYVTGDSRITPCNCINECYDFYGNTFAKVYCEDLEDECMAPLSFDSNGDGRDEDAEEFWSNPSNLGEALQDKSKTIILDAMEKCGDTLDVFWSGKLRRLPFECLEECFILANTTEEEIACEELYAKYETLQAESDKIDGQGGYDLIHGGGEGDYKTSKEKAGEVAMDSLDDAEVEREEFEPEDLGRNTSVRGVSIEEDDEDEETDEDMNEFFKEYFGGGDDDRELGNEDDYIEEYFDN